MAFVEIPLRNTHFAGLAVLAVILSGCMSMDETGPQRIQLALTPMTAACDAFQRDTIVAHSDSNSRTIAVPKTPGSTDLLCFAPGYKDKRITIVPDNPDKLAAALADFGPAELAAYPSMIQIVMEPADRQGLPR